ncbi:hypothetical protein [Chitinophaga japonensis]|uniref:Uncharacterized protein n=1 Tax=Chitinophaga japonensis TaxID=104662 RepID=A0A562TEE5_CHIJA|nr:hypothetical protein [Chitinophaga japonensis]TWI91634.1 hypothetical protein LX66_1009 [Chitinophaga japonensis]
MHRKLFIVISLITTILTVSCSKDNDEPDGGTPTTHKVVFKAEVSPGGDIVTAAYGIDSDAHTATNLSGATWSSPELTAPAGAINANIVINATGSSDAAILKVQIYVDDVLKKEESSTPGSILSVTTGYRF